MLTDYFIKNGVTLKKTYDTDFKVKQNETGRLYDEAIDILEATYTYSVSTTPRTPETPVEEDGNI